MTRCLQPYDDVRLCRVCRLNPEVRGLKRCHRMIARSPAMQSLLQRASAVAPSDASVLISGETGTGKEVLARALHANSARASRPFVAINVAAIPSGLLESELFGHVKGAFTGAVSARTGLLEAAHRGTLLLDEVGEMPLPMQAKLLRALQDGEIRRVGDSRTTSIDVRLICATHRDLASNILAGSFRQDLYYRIAVFLFHLPPLRDRPEDLEPLVRSFLEIEGLPDARIEPAAGKALQAWSWPGNVRELANVLQHAAVLARAESPATGPVTIARRHLPDSITAPPRPAPADARLLTLAQAEQRHVESVLLACQGNQAEAARVLSIGRNTLWRKIRAFAH
jgi:transcriptional regulator with GAF, ATPase, and Fis domain